MAEIAATPTQETTKTTSTPSPSGATGGGVSPGRVQMKSALARANGFDAQVQMLAPVQRHGGGEDSGQVHEAAARGISGGGSAMPFASQIQKSFGGHDISGVKAHTDGNAVQASADMGAAAYATGDHVAFGQSPDLHTAAHEAAHVVQQRAGVSLSGGVGQSGDAYEQHADRVADAVVQGKSAEGLLSEMSGGGGGAGVQHKAVQREDAPPSGAAPEVDRSMQIHNDGKVEGGKNPGTEDVERYKTAFKARVKKAFDDGKMSDKLDPDTKAEQVWNQIYGALQGDAGIGAMTGENGRVDMASEAYQKAILQISGIAAELAKMSSAQFLKAKSFGFWSKGEGRQLAEQISELTLETSGIGGVFDGIPTLNKSGMSWDPELWGGLSQAYGQAVAEQVVQGGKSINVCVGAGADKANNIWTEVEKTRVENVLKDGGMTLASVVHYWAAGADNQKDRNLRANLGEFPSRDDAITAADEDFKKIPADKGAPAAPANPSTPA